jgi:hypothetical protein
VVVRVAIKKMFNLLRCFFAVSGKPSSCVMAFSKPGDFRLEDFIPNVPVIDDDFYKFCFLPSIPKNSDIVLGDLNVIILKRIGGKFETYREADAFQFVLNIVIVGYKLIFIKL